MANREQRSNKEKRKPKADKPKPPAQTSKLGSSAGQAKLSQKGR